MRAYILREQNILLCRLTQVPVLEAADVLLVLTGQMISVNTVHLTYSLYTQYRRLDAHLLKKPQTLS